MGFVQVLHQKAQNLRFLRFDASISGHTAPAPLHHCTSDETRQEKYMALDSTWWHLKLLDNVRQCETFILHLILACSMATDLGFSTTHAVCSVHESYTREQE